MKINKNNSSVFASSMILAVCFVVFGLLLLIFPDAVINIVAYVLAIGVGIVGVYGLYKFFIDKDDTNYSKYGLAYGVLFIILALFIIFKKGDIIKILPYTIGAIIIISSTLKIDYIIKLKKENNENWKVTAIVTIICFLLGIILLFFPLESLSTVIRIIGLIIVFYSILDIVNTYIIKTNIDLPVTITEISTVIVNDNKEDEKPVEEANAEVKEEVKETPVKKSASKTTSVAKKATAKKTTATKTTTTKKPTTKKSTTKKPAAKKTTTKKPAAKKTTTKKEA